MIRRVKIEGFKNFSNEDLQIKPFTLVTGRNSTGKSSLLQAILMTQTDSDAKLFFKNQLKIDFSQSRNRYENAKEIKIEVENSSGSKSISIKDGEVEQDIRDSFPSLEKNMFYLSANRIGAENVVIPSSEIICGPNGEALISSFEKNKSLALDNDLITDRESYTLNSQVNYWLSYIMGIKLALSTEDRTTQIEVRYSSDGLPGVLPSQLGAGVSYVAKIVILCLLSKRGDVIMIENPEIHLYPLAQCKLAEFLTFIVNAGRQLIVETHSNDLITKVRYEIYKGKLNSNDVEVLYKEDILKRFKNIGISPNGEFSEEFPETFFDATLRELLEMD